MKISTWLTARTEQEAAKIRSGQNFGSTLNHKDRLQSQLKLYLYTKQDHGLLIKGPIGRGRKVDKKFTRSCR